MPEEEDEESGEGGLLSVNNYPTLYRKESGNDHSTATSNSQVLRSSKKSHGIKKSAPKSESGSSGYAS